MMFNRFFLMGMVALAGLGSCTLYEGEEKLLSSFDAGRLGTVEVFHLDCGATTQEVIQVRSSVLPGNKGVIANFFGQDSLKGCSWVNDSTLLMELNDTTVVVSVADSIRRLRR